MNELRKTKQKMHSNKKNKSKERKIIVNYNNYLRSQSFPPQKLTKTVKLATTNQWKAEYINKITCPARRNFYEQASLINNTISKNTVLTPLTPSSPQNMRRAFPLIEGDKNYFKQKRNAKGVYFARAEKPEEPPINQAKYNTWKVKKVENRAMNTNPQISSTHARQQQKEEEKRRRAFQEDIIQRGKLLHPRNSLIATQGDPHYRNMMLTEIIHIDIKPNNHLSNRTYRS